MNNPLLIAQLHITAVRRLVDTGGMKFVTAETPRPDAMRAYFGTSPEYSVNICQANVVGEGIITEGMIAVTSQGLMAIRLPPEIAKEIWDKITTSRN